MTSMRSCRGSGTAAFATCACGNAVELGSINSEIRVEICSNCHPFFTGKQKLVDTAGRVDKFMKKYEKHYQQAK